MSGADKFMPMYWGDYARDTGHLNNAGHGAYLMLIKHYWGSGRPLPDDDAQLWRIACCDSVGAWKKLRPVIEPFFRVADGLWRHGRVDRELVKAAERYEKRAKAGRDGGSEKWGLGSVGGDTRPPKDNARLRSERLAEARRKARHSPEEWGVLVEICGRKCVRCGATGQVVRDHIVPIYQGGDDGIGNIQPLCASCNSSKGPDRTDHRPPDWRERLAGALGAETPDKTPDERLAKRLSDACQPQPQPHLLTEKKATLLGPTLPAADADAPTDAKRATGLIAAFDAVIAEIWGDAQRRPWPAQTDLGTALRWLADGVTAELVRGIAEPRFRRMQAENRRRPDTLKFLDEAIRDTLADARRSGLPPPGQKPDPEREAAAKRYTDAVTRWHDAGREGPAPKPEDFGMKARAA